MWDMAKYCAKHLKNKAKEKTKSIPLMNLHSYGGNQDIVIPIRAV